MLGYYSRRTFTQAYPTLRQRHWPEDLEAALHHFGGVPKLRRRAQPEGRSGLTSGRLFILIWARLVEAISPPQSFLRSEVGVA